MSEFLEERSLSDKLRQVYSYMTLGLLLSVLTAYYCFTSNLWYSIATSFAGYGSFIMLFLQLGLVFYFSSRFTKMSFMSCIVVFISYCIITGINFAILPMVYSVGSIFLALAFTGGLFGIMSIIGYTTNVDLSKLKNILYIGLLVLIGEAILGMFLDLSATQMLFNFLGVVIFVGLTAYDTQKIKNWYQSYEFQNDHEAMGKLAIMGALTLYLDFVNIFLYILRIVGRRN